MAPGDLHIPDRALELARAWPLTASYELAQLSQFEGEGGAVDERPDQWQINLRCATLRGYKLDAPGDADPDAGMCGQSVAMVAAAGAAFVVNLEGGNDDLLSGVLRHLVTAHNLSLSGAPQ